MNIKFTKKYFVYGFLKFLKLKKPAWKINNVSMKNKVWRILHQKTKISDSLIAILDDIIYNIET